MAGARCNTSPPAAARRIGRRCTAALLLLLALTAAGCDPSADRSDTNGASADAEPPRAEAPTIVSLTPAVTQMLIDMGKRDQIIGISREDTAELDTAQVGSYNDPLLANLLKLGPDLVITETVDGELDRVPPRLRSYAADGVFRLAVLPHSLSIADVQRALTDPERGLGHVVGDPEAAARARRTMSRRMQRVREAVADAPRPRVLMLLQPTTLGAIGTGVTHAELLELAGAVNAAGAFEAGYVTLTRSQVQQTVRPDIVLILKPNSAPITGPDDPRLAALRGLDVPAVTQQRIVVIDHPQVLLASTALPGVLRQMAKAIHPDRTEAIDRAYAEPDQQPADASTGGPAPDSVEPDAPAGEQAPSGASR